MQKRQEELHIGTSGWSYSQWAGIFYPKDLAIKDKLKYFSKHFKNTEINYSFYHLPSSSTYQNWYKLTPEDFLFAVKASRFITHIKRIQGVKKAWKTFIENALNLKEKLGPILFQFPPSFKNTEENIKRLREFLKFITSRDGGFHDRKQDRGRVSISLKYAFEFRHKSWCDEKVYKILRRYNIAWVIADLPNYPKDEVVTAGFIYIRMHGGKVLYTSNYSKKELKNWAEKIKKYLKRGLDVYIYFNNDAMGCAIENAKELLKFCK